MPDKKYSRRDFLKTVGTSFLGSAGILANSSVFAQNRNIPRLKLTPREIILQNVAKLRPLNGGRIPNNFKSRLGVTHVDGKYCLSKKPFLLEGCQKVQEFGAGVIKLWLETPQRNYPFNSDWSNLPEYPPIVDILKHPYFVEAFKYPFSTFVLEVKHIPGMEYGRKITTDFKDAEEEMEEVTTYLYETYSKKNVNFVLQNWEGDWLFRESLETKWNRDMLKDLPDRVASITKWFRARQNGVEKARRLALEKKPKPKCKVMHALEVNRVFDIFNQEPTLVELVLPQVPVDLVSWSSYEGLLSGEDGAVSTWHGLEIIKYYMKSSGFLPKKTVMIGEIGVTENEHTPQIILDVWDTSLGVFFAHNVPLILHWQLYCNEPKHMSMHTVLPQGKMLREDEMRGFWLYKPNGSLSVSGKYLKKVLENTNR